MANWSAVAPYRETLYRLNLSFVICHQALRVALRRLASSLKHPLPFEKLP